jgi:hypothetical protein
MRRSTVYCLPLAVVAALSACQGEIPVVGFDAEGKAIETMVPRRRYVTQLASNVDQMSESVLPVMDSDKATTQLGLRGIRLGLGLKGSVGLGDYWKLGGNIGFNLHFANKN